MWLRAGAEWVNHIRGIAASGAPPRVCAMQSICRAFPVLLYLPSLADVPTKRFRETVRRDITDCSTSPATFLLQSEDINAHGRIRSVVAATMVAGGCAARQILQDIDSQTVHLQEAIEANGTMADLRTARLCRKGEMRELQNRSVAARGW